MLATPTPQAAFAKPLGVTRQRVGQLLQRLLQQGKAVRIPDPDGHKRWLWSQPGACTRDSIRSRPPSLTDARSQVLNALATDTFHSTRDVATILGQTATAVRGHIRELNKRGLVARLQTGLKRYFTITPRGLEHPARVLSATHAAAADISKAFCEPMLKIIETLAVLGEARTIDITAALAGVEKPGVELFSGQRVARLTKTALVERVAERTGRGQRSYRLTEAGKHVASLIAQHRRPPAAARIHQRIALYRAMRTGRQREIGRGTAAARYHPYSASPAQRAILDRLTAGACSTPVLSSAVRGHLTNPKSIYLTLRSLTDRGAITPAGRDGLSKVWALATVTAGP